MVIYLCVKLERLPELPEKQLEGLLNDKIKQSILQTHL